MRSRLFLKIYLTLLASLVALAVAGAVLVRLNFNEQDGWLSRRDAFLAAMLPADAETADTQATLQKLGKAFDADITVFSPKGTAIASVGAPLPFSKPEGARGMRSGPGHNLLVARLPGDRVAVARLTTSFGPSRANALAVLALITLVTAGVAWPVVRHLTRRLERLRHGVEEWGEGKLAERVAVEGSDEVAAVAESFNRAAGRIEELVAAHRSLLANASHELRSPLARLRMAIDLYETAPNAELKGEIVPNLTELDELVGEILLTSRLEHVEEIGSTERIELLALAAEEGTRYGIPVTGEAAMVTGDLRLVARLVRNLVQNALRHGAPPFSIEVRRGSDQAILIVEDHGPGIPESERARVFQPFYRPAGYGEAGGGWGLGLALVHQIAVRHGATVQYETAEGGGARFIVLFPAARV